ncbi:MAG: hypothetical protein JNJ57_10400 [Saprospiraceae bacterium]|nr:hypothetical protein [Saprospiraceae bacterium]
MITRTSKWVTWLWVFTLLTATVGVSVQQIYCYCVGKTTLALFDAADACKTEPQHACCTDKQPEKQRSCCGKPVQQSKSHDCTKKTTRFFQLKTEFTLEKKAENQPVGFDFEAISTQVFYFLSPAQSFTVFTGFHAAPKPPPVSGRTICLRHGVFRC